jgi:small subunit ribosomal protein S5
MPRQAKKQEIEKNDSEKAAEAALEVKAEPEAKVAETKKVEAVEADVVEVKAEPEAKKEEVKEVAPVKAATPKNLNVSSWKPKTELGKKVLSGEVTDITKVYEQGLKISEPMVVDALLPNIEKEMVMIGGVTGKGGGIKKTPFRRTARMHKSGRRYRISCMTIIGNRNGYVGIGLATGPTGKNQEVIEKSTNKSKISLIPVSRGCGSWECSCGKNHSIPFAIEGRSGSVTIKLIPAPKGIGLAVSDEVKKLLKLAGISDVWCKTRGNSQMRINLVKAAFNALKKTNTYKTNDKFEKDVGMTTGKAE